MILRTLINKYIKIIKEHYTAITLIPIILGGIWQIMALASINVSYVRYFSVTQIIPDGMTIIFIMGGIGSLWIIGKTIFQENIKNTENEKLDTEDNIVISFGVVMIFVIGTIALHNIFQSTGVYKRINNQDINILKIASKLPLVPETLKLSQISIVFIFLVATSGFLGLIRKIIYKIIKLIKKWKRGYTITKFMKKDVYTIKDENIGVIYICIIGACMYFISTLSTAHPRLNKDIGAIKYMNDKYIFFEVTNNSGTFIEIRPFEELFTSNPPTNSGQLTSTP